MFWAVVPAENLGLRSPSQCGPFPVAPRRGEHTVVHTHTQPKPKLKVFPELSLLGSLGNLLWTSRKALWVMTPFGYSELAHDATRLERLHTLCCDQCDPCISVGNSSNIPTTVATSRTWLVSSGGRLVLPCEDTVRCRLCARVHT